MGEATETREQAVRCEAAVHLEPVSTNGLEPCAGSEGAAPGNDNVFEGPDLEAVLESLLLAAGSPVPLGRLVEALDGPDRREVGAAVDRLARRLEREGRGIRLVRVAGGFQLRSAPQHGPFVRRLLGGKPPRLSRPMLETLAIIAYRQPCTRPEIEAIRGVDCGAVIGSLLERRLIRMQGRKEAPGRPLLYATTRDFLEVFGLPDLQALPPLGALGEGAELLRGEAGELPAGASGSGSEGDGGGDTAGADGAEDVEDEASLDSGAAAFEMEAGLLAMGRYEGTEGVSVAGRGGARD